MERFTKTVPIDTSLLTFIRDHAQLKGTKFMCLEGGCGACIVNVTQVHPATKQIVTKAENSCLLPVYSCHGRDILTVEGIGSRGTGYNAVQKRLASFNGSQCGYCSPGMVMSMYSLLEGNPEGVTMRQVEGALDGNICRCTGYRPILDAFKSFATDVDEKVSRMCQDIEDLESCSSRKACEGVCVNGRSSATVRRLIGNGQTWYRVRSVESIFEIFKTIEDEPYMLIAGNTAHGVYRRREDLKVFIDVSSVAELQQCRIDAEVIVGANVTLDEFIRILEEAAAKNGGHQYLSHFVKHLGLVANTAVRNAGTIAGNLMIKHQHPEFPSDVFLLLETVGATLSIRMDELRIDVSPLEFLNLDMSKAVLLAVTLPSLDPTLYRFRSFKVMPVSRNNQAYVNAGFLIKSHRSDEIVECASICFGGINPVFVHASSTECFLVGRPLLTNETLQGALQALATELEPDWVLPDASPNYRRRLALSLYYKFMLGAASESSVGAVSTRFTSGSTMLERPLSSGKQNYDTYPTKWPLTQYLPKLDGILQASGEAEYINDMPRLPNELYAAFVLASVPKSRVVQIDASAALQMEGVRAFYSAQNIPGINNFMSHDLGYAEGEEILCSGEVLFHGQPLGIVVATSFELANRATELVEVCYEALANSPVFTSARDVIESGAYNRVSNQNFDRHGSQYDAAHEGPIKIQGCLELNGQYHYTMETQTCFCVPVEDGLDVYCASHHTKHALAAISQALNVQENSVNLKVRRVGGAYGAKSTRASQIAAACALAAQLTRRPVRMVLPMETNMSAIGKRQGVFSEYEVDVDKSGRINRLNHTYTHDSGAVINERLAFMTSDMFKNCYRTDRWNLVGNIARTDVCSNTICRAPGTSEGISMIENIMEHIAHVTRKDPLEVRLLNMNKENKMYTLLPEFRKSVEFDDRRKAVDLFNRYNRWRKRGIAIIPMEYPLEYSGTLNAMVSIYYKDATVAITHGAIEMGQGVNTKVVQVASHILGVPISKIIVKPNTSLTSPNCAATVHSQASETAAFAVQRCCETLVERFLPYKKNAPQASWEEIVGQAYLANEDLAVTYNYQPNDLQAYVIWGLACAEVEVDILTGNVQVSRVDILEDVGESMNPAVDVGQVEGAFIMGLGYYLTEALTFDPSNGALTNNRSWNYKVPGAHDIPVDFRVQFLRNSSNPHGVLRSKAVAEPALSMSPVLTYALRYALRSARLDAGYPDEWVHLGTGNTPERIFMLAGNSIDQFKLY
ncbi:hypothetical protein quinque_003379 [Culex quinquefasciatus]